MQPILILVEVRNWQRDSGGKPIKNGPDGIPHRDGDDAAWCSRGVERRQA